MSDNRKYFHWKKDALIKECCTLNTRVEDLELWQKKARQFMTTEWADYVDKQAKAEGGSK